MIPGNYWNRIDDNTKVKIALNFQRLAFNYGKTNGVEGVNQGYLQNIINDDTKNSFDSYR